MEQSIHYSLDPADAINAERSLILAAQHGDREAFSALYQRHKDAVYWFVLKSVGSREDAEDIVQEAFCRAWSAIGRFRGQAQFATWIFRIAARACADRARSARLHGRQVPIEAAELTDCDGGLDVTRQALARALGELPLAHRQLVLLCDVQGFTSREAAEILGCTAISVRVRLCRAHDRLRQLLSDEESR